MLMQLDKYIRHVIADYPMSYESVNTTTLPSVSLIQTSDAVVYPCPTDIAYSGAAAIAIIITLVFIALLTVGGNFLVILAVILVRKLQTPSNILIVSLAFSDFLVGFLVLPFSITDVVFGYWPLSKDICHLYISFDVLLCTASILNLCAISIDRYLVITRPLTYVINRTPCRMAKMIAVAWMISTLICVPPQAWSNMIHKGNSHPSCQCEYSESVGYQIFALFFAFYLPLVVMVVLYGRIFKLAREMSRSEQQRMVTSFQPEQGIENHKASIVRSSSTSTKVEPIDFRQCSTILANTGQNSVIPPIDQSVIINGNSEIPDGLYSVKCVDQATGVVPPNTRTKIGEQHQRKVNKANSDTKVVKTLGVIMGCFCLCWVPFFTIQLVETLRKASLDEEERRKITRLLPPRVFQFLQWLGYMNSFLNPFIYAKFNREFRSPFKLILLLKCRNINARLRSVAFSNQYGLPPTSRRRRTSSWWQSISSSSDVNRRSRNSSVFRTKHPKPGRPRPQSVLHSLHQSEEANLKAGSTIN